MEIVKVTKTPGINLLVYGHPGSGKTTLAATAQDHPDMKEVLFLDVEGGMLSVAKRGDLHAVRITSLQQCDEIIARLLGGDKELSRFKTVVVDSGSELQTISLENIVDGEIAAGKRKPQQRDSVQLADYGRSTHILRRIFRNLKDLPVNTIVTALPKEVYPRGSQNSPPEAVMPAFTQSLARSVMGYFDFVWYAYQDAGEFHLLTQPEGPFLAKTRGAAFPVELGKVVDNPNLKDILNLLKKSEFSTKK